MQLAAAERDRSSLVKRAVEYQREVARGGGATGLVGCRVAETAEVVSP
jgi:hypothetical protein